MKVFYSNVFEDIKVSFTSAVHANNSPMTYKLFVISYMNSR